MAGRHVVRQGGVLAVAAAASVGGDAFAAEEHLDRAGGKPGIDLGPGVAMRDTIEMVVDLDVIVDPDPADPPFRQHVGFSWQRLQCRTIHRLE